MEKENFKDLLMKKLTKVSSDCSGVGSFIQALNRLNINHEESFACDFDYYARQTYLLNFGNENDIKLSNSKEHKKFCDGVQKIALSHKTPSEKEVLFLDEANEYAKTFSFYYPFNMYQREIPNESDDIYVGSFPCQSFSLAGKRKGEDDKKGILFYEGHRYIYQNKPRYFILENVKGLLSDDNGKTFQRWIDYLGGKSVNGNPVIFPHDEATPYHVYYQVMNAKHYGVPQNRERIFIIGIRDDSDNEFSFPKPVHLVKRLKDVLEPEVDEKYFLSDKMIEGLIKSGDKSFINQDTQASQVFSEEGTSPNICAGTHGYANGYVETKIGTWRTHEDGRGFRPTEDNNCPTIPARAREDGSGQPVIKIGAIRGRNPNNPLSRVSGLPTEQMLEINENGTSNALTTVQKDNVVVLTNKVPTDSNGYPLHWKPLPDEIKNHGKYWERVNREDAEMGYVPNKISIPTNNSKGYDIAEEEEDSINFSNPNSETRRGRVGHGVSQTLDTACNQGILTQQRIRRLTPLECFRLMDFNEDFKWNVSDSQAYKQAGNSIPVAFLVEIIQKLKLT